MSTLNSAKTAQGGGETGLPNLILLDIVMKDMDGYEVLGRLKGDDKLKKIREMLDFRGPIYEEAADHIIDTDDLDAGAVAKEIANIAKSS